MFSPSEDVDAVTDVMEAARLRVEFEHALRRPNLTDDERESYREAIAKLDREWPHNHREALAATEAELYGDHGMPRGYRDTRHHLRSRHGVNATTAARMRRERASSTAGGSSKRSRPAGRSRPRAAAAGVGGELAGAGRQAASWTGADTLAGTTGDIVLATIRVGLGLALAYFLLSSRGSRGLSAVLGTLTGAMRAFVAPVDPLFKAPKPTSKGGAFLPATVGPSAIPAQQAGESNAAFDARMFRWLQQHPQGASPSTTPTPTGAAIFGAGTLGRLPSRP